jgi:A/G-specific adenine glycosylase
MAETPGSGSRLLIARAEDANGLPSTQALDVLHEELLGWYKVSRRDLPWRRTSDPYAIWVSEVMLQQTRVETVVPYYDRFLRRFPTALALAEAPIDDVLASWSGLGYYRRARLLHAGAKHVATMGDVPRSRDALRGVPGIGPYTAGAIASIAFGQRVGLVDGNVARVLARLFAIEDDMRRTGMRRATEIADAIVDERDPGAWNQALMELGATICTPKSPACDRCPVAVSCRARAEDRVASLPLLGAKTKPIARRMQSLVAVSKGLVLLARRKRDGLFGGLWEPPSIEGARAAKEELLRRVPVTAVTKQGSIVHVLSHRRLTVDVHVAALAVDPKEVDLPEPYEEARLVDPTELGDIGIAALARKVLAKARV